ERGRRPDEEYLDGHDPQLAALFGRGNRNDRAILAALLKKLPPMRDDFVQLPVPLIALSDPGGTALIAEALQAYQKEAGVVDPRLAARVTLELKGAALDEFCSEMEKQARVRMRAERGVADEKVTIFLKDCPARDVMRAVARLFGYKWARTGAGTHEV